MCCCQFLARSAGDELQSYTSSNSFAVTFVHERCRLLLMSANSWEEAKCLICGWDDSLPTRAPGEAHFVLCLVGPRCHCSRLSADRAVDGTRWQNDRPSPLHLQIYRWSWAVFWSERSVYEPHGEIEQRWSPGSRLYFCFFCCFVLKAEKIQFCALISLYLRPKLLFYNWSAKLNLLADQIEYFDRALR